MEHTHEHYRDDDARDCARERAILWTLSTIAAASWVMFIIMLIAGEA